MLTITIPACEKDELWDDEHCMFISQPPMKEQTLQLEHSLISLSKWESRWCKPFYSNTAMSIEETLDYIKCMTINKNVDPEAYGRLSDDDIKQITNYIYSPMTATVIYEREQPGRINRKKITSELIYYWMIAHNIPFECEKWHLNRLITLIRICNIKNTPPKKRGKRDMLSERAALNAARRKQYNTRG